MTRHSKGNKKDDEGVEQRVKRILSSVPLIDGHNDLPNSIRFLAANKVSLAHIDQDLSQVEPWASSKYSHTDLGRLRAGMVGAQFWAAYMDCDT